MRKSLFIAAVILGLMAPGSAHADDENPTAQEILKAFRSGKSVTITQRGDYDDLVNRFHTRRYPYSTNYPLGYYPPRYYSSPAPGVTVYQGRAPINRWDKNPARATGYIAGKIID